MILLALCDDDNAFLKNFSKVLNNYFKENNIDVNIKIYNNGKKLLMSNYDFEFMFLDIDMPEVAGTEIAKIFRKHNNPYIIFVTNHDSLVYESIRYQPLRFLRKSKIDKELDEVLKTIIQIYNAEIKTITFKTEYGNVEKRLNDIMYFDVLNHDVVAHTKDSETHVYGTLNNYEQKLKNDDFIRIQKSYLVNCNFIYAINRKDVILDNQISLPLSRHKIDEVKKIFHDYLRRN